MSSRPSFSPDFAAHAAPLYRDLFFAERSRRESVRSSLSFTVSGVAFYVYAVSTLASQLEPDRLPEPVTCGVLGLGVASLLLLIVGAVLITRVEWRFSYEDPPDIYELARTSEALAERDQPVDLDAYLATAYYLAYMRYLRQNTRSGAFRAWALRMVLAALVLLALAFALTPFQGALS